MLSENGPALTWIQQMVYSSTDHRIYANGKCLRQGTRQTLAAVIENVMGVMLVAMKPKRCRCGVECNLSNLSQKNTLPSVQHIIIAVGGVRFVCTPKEHLRLWQKSRQTASKTLGEGKRERCAMETFTDARTSHEFMLPTLLKM